MSLYGALFSGVSGLTAQSSAMGAISDNITNVSTVGYKDTRVHFQTLVTKQTSSTFYSAGGVQSKPRQSTDVQGLLQASTSQTDIAISGQGFFVVNEAARPTISNQYLYTRAGSFIMDNEGYLRNAQGYYLQGWPTDASGNVIPANDSLSIANQNVISTDYLETINLSRVGGTATATTTIGIGANLPASDTTGQTHKTDVQFFDTLGQANTISFVYTRTQRENQWDVSVQPPQNTAVLTLYQDTAGANVYKSVGQLEFDARPADDATVVIGGVTYEFDNDASGASAVGNVVVDISAATSVAEDVTALYNTIIANDSDFTTTNARVQVSAGSSTTLIFTDDGTGSYTIDPTGLLDSSGEPITAQESSFTVQKTDLAYQDYRQLTFDATNIPDDGETIVINGVTYTFSTAEAADATGADTTIFTSAVDSAANLEAVLEDLEAAIEAQDPNFASGGTRIQTLDKGTSGNKNTLLVSVLASGSYDVDISGLGAARRPTEPDGTAFASTTVAVDKDAAIIFSSSGIPSAFNVTELEVRGFANGAADMDDDASRADRMTVDFGTVGEADGMTQFGDEFTPGFINQNGSKFGTFAGVTVDVDGQVTALFDNGETRKIYKIPIATFTNPNFLESKTGNVWSSTEASGDFTLREADNGPAGQVVQGSLEASTVDIGNEFTQMIVVQRAYSASTKIISTADQMLEELMRVKN